LDRIVMRRDKLELAMACWISYVREKRNSVRRQIR
jgi:hypothetical protein